MSKSNSLISKNESTSIKGFAILLIILGHIGRNFASLQFWLYPYHLILFFMLPHLYGKKVTQPTRILNSFIRMYIPYVWCFALCTAISIAIGYTALLTPIQYFAAFINGSQNILKETTGFNFPWFMPAFFFSSLFICIKDISKKWTRLLTLAILLYGLFIILYMAITTPSTVYSLSCISRAAAYFFLGYIAYRFIIKKQDLLNTPHYRYPLIIIFIFSLTGQAMLQKYHITITDILFPSLYTTIYFITEILAPVAALCLLYGFKRTLSKQKFLTFIGTLSFEIYCFHVIILNCLWKLTDILRIPSSPIIAVFIFLFTIILSIGVAIGIKRIAPLHHLLFPKRIKSR